MIEDPDSDILAGLAQGDPGSCALFIQRRLPQILATARRMLGNDQDAEDVAQDVCMKAFAAATDWRPGRARFSTWLYRVTINLCYDRLRSRRARGVHGDIDDVDVPDAAPDGLAQLMLRERAEAVELAIRALPGRQRLALELTVNQELSQRDAAEIMDISEHALESLLARARRKLRAWLVGELDEVTP